MRGAAIIVAEVDAFRNTIRDLKISIGICVRFFLPKISRTDDDDDEMLKRFAFDTH